MDEAETERNTMLLRRETSRAWLECWGAWDIGARDEAVGRPKPWRVWAPAAGLALKSVGSPWRSELEKGRMVLHLWLLHGKGGREHPAWRTEPPAAPGGRMVAGKRCLRVKHFNRWTGRWMKERPWETTFVKSTPAFPGFSWGLLHPGPLPSSGRDAYVGSSPCTTWNTSMMRATWGWRVPTCRHSRGRAPSGWTPTNTCL